MLTRIPFVANSSTGETFEPLVFLREHFFFICILCIAWVVGVIVFSAFRRNRAGKPIFYPKFENPLFSERWLSGRSLKGFFSAGANRCLWVTVSNRELWVCPHFPFNLFTSMYKKSGLEHRISGSDIISVEHSRMNSGGGQVIVRYRNGTETEEAFAITIRDVQAFDRAIAEIRSQPAPT